MNTLDGTNGLILDPSGQPIQNVTSINSGYLYGNRVINGAQEIDQVNNGAAVTPTTNAYLTDMFGTVFTQASKLTFQQVADAPANLKNSLKVTVAAQYAPAATDAFTLLTAIEGKDVIDFQMGTSGAATFTISNWIKGSVAGTYSVALKNAALNRSYVGTISVTTSWAPVKITVTGDLTGTWATDNTVGLYIQWDLGSGSNFNTTAGAWQAGQFNRTSGSVTFVNQVAGSTLNITGVDCRLGSVAPAYFERRANELQLAQRYYEFGVSALYIGTANSFQYSTYNSYKVSKRISPTVSAVSFLNTGFPTTNSILNADANGFAELRVANASVANGAFNSNWTASARLF